MPEHPDLSPQGRVLSWPGRIHIYAGIPEGEPVNDSFAGLLAVGGFACASPLTIGACLWGENTRHVQGIIDDVEIRSLGKLVTSE